MLELERKYWKEYRKEKKQIKKYNKIINDNKTKFYIIFNYLIKEYYQNLKKEFLDSEIAKQCSVSIDIVNEIKIFLENKKLAKVIKNKLNIDFQTIIFLEELSLQNKKNTINFLGIIIFIISIIVIILSTRNFIFESLKIIGILICIIISIGIIGIMIHIITNKKINTK